MRHVNAQETRYGDTIVQNCPIRAQTDPAECQPKLSIWFYFARPTSHSMKSSVNQSANASPRHHTVAVWNAVEIALTASRTYADPFRDPVVDAVFHGPGGRTIRRPAFWDGNNRYKVRFAPPAPGKWTWSTTGPADDNGLHRQSGSIDAKPYRGDNPFFLHGFLTVSEDRRSLCHADGTPFFWLGDTHWLWEQERLDGNGPDFYAMARTRKGQRFNVYQVELFERWDGNLPNLKLFQENIDPKWRWLAENGFATACTHGLLTTRPDSNTAPMETAMARYLCARYGAYPSVWLMFQECTGHYSHWFENNSQRDRFRDVVRAVGRAYRRFDSYTHPRTAHSDASLKTHYRGEDWLDFTLLQGGHEARINRDGYYDLFFEDRRVAIPQIEGEANYELLYDGADPGRPAAIGTAMMREKAWMAMLSGCAGYTLGANGVWQAIDRPNDSDLHKVYGRTSWKTGIALPGANHLTHLRRFFESIPWHQLVPRPECDGFCSAPLQTAVHDRPVVATDRTGKWVVAYLPPGCGNGTVLLRLGKGPWNVSWFDPRSSRRLSLGMIRPKNGTWRVPDKPGPDDWVLRLEAVGTARALVAPPSWGRVRAEREADRQRNIAVGADTECSSNDSTQGVYSPRHAVDGNTDPGTWSHWSSDPARETPSPTQPAWLTVTWPRPVDVESIRLTFKSDYVTAHYALEVDGVRLVDVDNNTDSVREHRLDKPRAIRRLRFLGMRGPAHQPTIVRVVEIEVLAPRTNSGRKPAGTKPSSKQTPGSGRE